MRKTAACCMEQGWPGGLPAGLKFYCVIIEGHWLNGGAMRCAIGMDEISS